MRFVVRAEWATIDRTEWLDVAPLVSNQKRA